MKEITNDDLKKLDLADVAFGTTALLPKYEDIPDDFKRRRTIWNDLFSSWFFDGLSALEMKPKPGIDGDLAMKAIRAHMVSWEPKHEHKEAGVAWMMDQLFESATWEVAA